MLLNSVGLEVREPHGFAAGPLSVVMARDRLGEETRISVSVLAVDEYVRQPGAFFVLLLAAAKEMAALHDKWMREGEEWDQESHVDGRDA